MTDTNPAPITFEQITKLGQRRVDDTRIVEVPALGGTVKIRQLSGADQDAAVALGHAGDTFDAHAVAREQIRRSLVEPALPEAEADAIIDNLPVQAFGQLQSIVQANSGLLGIGVEDLVATFRAAALAADEDANRSDLDDDTADDDGVGSPPDADAADGVEGVPSVAAAGAGSGGEAAVDAIEAREADRAVTA